MAKTKKVSVSIDSDLYENFEEMRKKHGKGNRSKEIQKAIEMLNPPEINLAKSYRILLLGGIPPSNSGFL